MTDSLTEKHPDEAIVLVVEPCRPEELVTVTRDEVRRVLRALFAVEIVVCQPHASTPPTVMCDETIERCVFKDEGR